MGLFYAQPLLLSNGSCNIAKNFKTIGDMKKLFNALSAMSVLLKAGAITVSKGDEKGTITVQMRNYSAEYKGAGSFSQKVNVENATLTGTPTQVFKAVSYTHLTLPTICSV